MEQQGQVAIEFGDEDDDDRDNDEIDEFVGGMQGGDTVEMGSIAVAQEEEVDYDMPDEDAYNKALHRRRVQLVFLAMIVFVLLILAIYYLAASANNNNNRNNPTLTPDTSSSSSSTTAASPSSSSSSSFAL
jgi:cytoskeletal protein RodZ